jgi:endonuclease/exonuclease/phosphatase family metal-dependent hydrolase
VRRTLRSRTITTMTAALLLAAATVFTTGAAPAAASGTVKVMDFNICGAICNHGGYGVVEDVRNRVLRFRPAILTLNEVCAGQFWRLTSRLKGSAWEMSGVFRPQRHDSRCPGGGFGDAVLTAGAVGRREVLPLPNLGPEHRAVLCLRTSAGGGPVLACTLHLVTGRGTTGSREKYLQSAAAARALNSRAARGAVIVGGDFNLVPGQMGALLNAGRGGRFFDVDPQAAATHGRKIDYILFSRGHFANPSGGPEWSKYSDHRALLGQATRR